MESTTYALPATPKQIAYARLLALRNQTLLPWEVQQDRRSLSAWIDAQAKLKPGTQDSRPTSKQVAFAERLANRGFMIITGAVNVYPSSVESVLEQHPGVAEICVVGAPHPDWGEAVVAVVAPHNGRPLPSVEDLRAFGESHLSRMELPKHVLRLDSFPRTSTEKVDKRAIQEFVREQASALPWWQGRTVES